jgi:hypothetical protein
MRDLGSQVVLVLGAQRGVLGRLGHPASESNHGRSTAIAPTGTDGCGERRKHPAAIAGGIKLGTHSIIACRPARDHQRAAPDERPSYLSAGFAVCSIGAFRIDAATGQTVEQIVFDLR